MRIFVKKIAGLDTRDDEAADKLEKAAAAVDAGENMEEWEIRI